MTWTDRRDARKARRAGLPMQPRNERGNIIGLHGTVQPGAGTLMRDERAMLASVRVRPKRWRHREWPSVDPRTA